MATIYLLRHGQTSWNKDPRFRGRKDVPLSEEGKREAEAAADFLETAGVTRLYSSPLSRAAGTLAPLAGRLGLEVTPFQDVIDMDFGEWEGLSIGDAEKRYPDLFELWKNQPEKITFPGGESLDVVQARAMRGVSRLAVEFPEETIALCSHRVLCKLIVLGLFGAKPDKFWLVRQDTACINHFTYAPPRAVVYSINQTCHLDKLENRLPADF